MTEMAQKGPRKRLRRPRFVYEVSRWGSFVFKPIVDPKKVGFCRLISQSWVDIPYSCITHFHNKWL